MITSARRFALFVPALLGLLASACVDEKIVFRDRELFEEPLTQAQGFLGYSNQDAKLTSCGNCHVGTQSEWDETAHADAWATLQESGGAQEFCNGCHTVGQLGNPVQTAAGYEATGEDRYHDVQCESCHGPGLDHVTDPEAGQPLASMAVGLDLTQGCAECHQGTHHPFVEEWSQSAHGSVNAYPAGRASCESCHTGEGALKAWGINADYQEKGSLDDPGQHMAITCAVCHDPHGSENSGQLRFSIDTPSEEENLCMRCHHKRGTPDPSTFRGPHSPQGPLLVGTAGWWPPSLEFEGPIVATHGSDRNPRLCAGCHVNSFTVTDASTGDFTFQATGHLFEATPCMDADGVPQAGGDCAETEKTYQTCTTAGCHGTESTARALLANAQTRLNNLADELEGLLAKVPATEFSTDDNRYTAAEGSRFNADLARFGGTAVHNPVLTEALLLASIREVKSRYGVSSTAQLHLERILGGGDASPK
ncbi:MAG: cytochrome c3 family protein [Longimicrobiales bacterium]